MNGSDTNHPTPDSNKTIITEIIKNAFGDSRNITTVEPWGGGAHNTCYKIEIANPLQTIFLKIEKDDICPQTRKFQIEREVYGNRLAAAAGIPCPAVLAYSFDKQPARYLIQEFILGKLVGEYMEDFTEEEKLQVSQNIKRISEKLETIHSDTFGEVFNGGGIGRHKTWKAMMIQLSRLLLEDARS